MTASAPTAAPDWSAVRDEAVRHLQALLRIDTVNPPGNEIAAARYLEQVLRAEGIETELVEPAPGKAALRARLRASPGGGASGPGEGALLLLAHLDVVPVEATKWTVEPFAGVVRDGYVYGRGAIDDKGMLAANLMVLLLLKRHVVDRGGALSRDVVLLATSDEETGGPHGIAWIAAHRPDFLEATDAINEGGRVRIVGGRTLYAAVQCAEKVPHTLLVTARGPSGHAAVPLAANAVWRLGRALAALGAHREPATVIPTARAFFAQLATVWPDAAQARAMADVASEDLERVRRGEAVLAEVPVLDAVLRAGVSATIVSGGTRANVIPGEVRATLNVRTLPGQHVQDVVARLRRTIDDPLVEVTIASEGDDAPCTPHDAGVYAAIAEAVQELEPGLCVLPYLSTGATDSARLRRLGIRAFGILPFPLNQDDEERMHGHDERVPVASLLWGVRAVWGAVIRCVMRDA